MNFSLFGQLTNPCGFWFNGCSSAKRKILHDTCERTMLIRQDAVEPVCGPSDVNGVALSSATPAKPGPGVRIPRKSNFDLTGSRLVHRGDLVSWNGFRGRVARVRMGTCYPFQNSSLYVAVGAFVDCNSVQVVQ